MGEDVNTDDRNPVEFSFARMVAQTTAFDVERMRAAAAALGCDRPSVTGVVDWDRVARRRVEIYTIASDWAPVPPDTSAPDRQRAVAHGLYVSGRLAAAVSAFRKQPRPPAGLVETALFAEGLAERGDPEAADYLRALGAAVPAEADAATARLAYRRGLPDVAADALVSAFTRYRSDPWPSQDAMARGLGLAQEIAAAHPVTASRLYEALTPPFAIRALEQQRRFSRVLVARAGGLWKECGEASASLEPHLPWRPDMLRARAECYEHTGDPRARAAARDLQDFLAAEAPATAQPTAPITAPSGTPR
jgi:hypothetical protein